MSAFITIATTVTITAVTTVTVITAIAAITDTVIISGLLLSYLPLVGRSDLSYRQRKDAIEQFCRVECKVTYIPLGMCFPFSILLFAILLFGYSSIV